MRWIRQIDWERGGAIGCAVVLFLGLCPRVGVADPLEEFFKLEDQMATAHEAYLQATEGAKAEGGVKPKRAHVSDLRPDILKKMDALVTPAIGTSSGAPIAWGTFFCSWNLDLDLDGLFARFETIVTHYSDNGGIDDVLPQVVEAALALEAADRWAGALDKLSRTAKRAQSKTGALLALGQLRLRAGKPSKAKAAFTRMLASTTDKELSKLAKGYLFEVDRLQVGMVAPGFSTKTLDGKSVSLESLRGKAVLLNFWASW